MNEEENVLEDENLDLEWINNFEEENKLYDKFNLEPNKHIKIKFIYIDISNNIEKIKNYVLNLSSVNKIKKEELCYSIVRNKENYKLSSIGLLTINIINIEDLYSDIPKIEIKPISFINDIEIPNSMNIFKHVNSLIILLNRKKKVTKSTTKKIVYKTKSKTKSKRIKEFYYSKDNISSNDGTR
jgi:hypothetical protein